MTGMVKGVYGLGLAAMVLSAGGCEECWVAGECGDCSGWDDDHRPPAPPTGLTSTTGDGQVFLAWYPVEDEDLAGYTVYVSRHPDGPYEAIGETGRTDFVDHGAVNGRTDYYAVTAVDRCGNESDFSRDTVFDTPRPEGFDEELWSRDSGHPERSGWDFSRFRRQPAGAPGTDLWLDGRGAGALLRVAPGGGLQDFGFGPLDEIGWAPDGGWSPTGSAQVIAGHSYAVLTPDGYYAKFHVVTAFNDRIVMDWAVQLDRGNRELSIGAPAAPAAPDSTGTDGAARAGLRSREG